MCATVCNAGWGSVSFGGQLRLLEGMPDVCPARGLILLLVFAGLGACTGKISDPLGSGAGGGTSVGTGGGDGSGAPTDLARTCRPVAEPMRALTARQYDAVVAQLLQDLSRPAQVLQVPQTNSKFDNHADWVSADETLVRFYVTSAETLATAAVSRQASLFVCSNPTAAQEDACIGRIVDTFGRRAYRRTLLADERASLLGVFHTVRALDGATWNDALSAVLQVVLQAPQFLYVTEVGVPVDGAERPTARLTPLEVATKMALLIWGSVPDDALLDAAEQGHLTTHDELAAQARRLLADEKAKTGFLHFATQWLEFDKLDGVNKSATRYPMWNAALEASARAELNDFVSSTYFNGGRFRDLMVSRQATVDAALAAVYGVTASPQGTSNVTLPEQRAGILTRVGWLAGHAHPEDTSPTLRGKAVRLRLLCEDIPPPPPGVNVTLPSGGGTTTLRQRLAAHVDASSSCSNCHRLMDPIGFGFENFDAVGAFRTVEAGSNLAIDSSGEIIGGTANLTFTGAGALSAMLADNPEANRCYLTQTYRYAQGRTETSKDRCHLDAVTASLPASATMADVVVGVVTSDAFLTREPIQ